MRSTTVPGRLVVKGLVLLVPEGPQDVQDAADHRDGQHHLDQRANHGPVVGARLAVPAVDGAGAEGQIADRAALVATEEYDQIDDLDHDLQEAGALECTPAIPRMMAATTPTRIPSITVAPDPPPPAGQIAGRGGRPIRPSRAPVAATPRRAAASRPPAPSRKRGGGRIAAGPAGAGGRVVPGGG